MLSRRQLKFTGGGTTQKKAVTSLLSVDGGVPSVDKWGGKNNEEEEEKEKDPERNRRAVRIKDFFSREGE